MNRSSIIAGLIFSLLTFASTVAQTPKEREEAVTIPLDKIWAKKMPGTRDIQELDKENKTLAGKALLDPISVSLVLRAEDLKWRDMARPGFAVSDTDLSALRAAHAVLVEGAKPREVFTPDEEITVVFFSEAASGDRVHLRKVERRGNDIQVQYRLEPYLEKHFSSNLALIPLGKLTAGKYRVEMNQLPREQKFVQWRFKPLSTEWSRQFLCKPFSFSVSEKRE